MLAGLTFAVFLPTLSAEFVYDARLQILADPFLHDAGNWWNVLTFRVLGMDVLDFNRPVHLASLMVDASIWGREPFGYHLTSIVIHVVNVVLVWLVARSLVENARPATASMTSLVPVLASGIFALHPLVTESVCEPSYREDLLAAMFTLAAVVVSARHRVESGLDVSRAAACAGCCLLAVASKESGVAAPLVMAAQWLALRPGDRSRFWPAAIGGGLMAVTGFLAARFLLEPSPSKIFEMPPVYPGGSFAAAMSVQPRILTLYAQLIAWPVNLCADYGGWSIQHYPLPLALVVLAILAGAGGWAAWRDRRIAFCLAIILLPLLPVSNLVPIYRAAADRYLYLPLSGVACLVACLLDSSWLKANATRRQAALVAALVAALALGAATLQRQWVWHDQFALWSDTYARNPMSFNGANGLSAALRLAGRGDEAVAMARRALDLSGRERGDVWITLALALDQAGRPEEADAAVRTALEKQPNLADPDARVAALAMEPEEADSLKRLLARIR